MYDPLQDPTNPGHPHPHSSSHHNFIDSLKSVTVSFLCGCLGGVANILSSHPLDTIKVRMQLMHLSFSESTKYMITHEGFSSLYKGLASPLFNVPLIYAVCFGSYELGKRLQGIEIHQEVTVSQSMLAGIVAGFGISGIMTPMELVKCRLQVDGMGQKVQRMTAVEMVRKTIHTSGFKELYKGNLITLLREIPSGAVYFGSYEYTNRKLKSAYGEHQFFPLISGGIAGLLSYMVGYPQDVIKTKLQCDSGTVRKYQQHSFIKDGGIISCTKQIWAAHGIRGFSKGFSACALRAILSESITFYVYENTKKFTNY